MSIINLEGREYLRIGTEPRLLLIKSEPEVIPTRRGYQPVIIVEEVHQGKEYIFFISAASVTDPLEEIRKVRGQLAGSQILVKKASEDPRSQYVVSEL